MQKDSCVVDSGLNNKVDLTQTLEHIKRYEQELKDLFEVEKRRFEEKNGNGTYDNKKWRGFMASYMCTFPAQYLDEIRTVISNLSLIENLFDIKVLISLILVCIGIFLVYREKNYK